MGATWLGGVATFTTTRDRCTEMVYCPSATVAGCVTWYFNIRSTLLVIYALIMMLSCLDDVSFNAFLIMMISMWSMMLSDYSFILCLLLAC